MFERYQRGTNPVLDRVVEVYGTARAAVQQLDRAAAFRIDDLRRARRTLDRVLLLERSLTETMSSLSELEHEVAEEVAQGLRDSRSQLQWVLGNLKR